MKTPMLSVFTFLLTLVTVQSQSIRFLDVVQKPSPTVSVEGNINERGGYITFDRVYRSGCTGGYKVKVTFSKSLNMLQPGETFQATLSCEHCNTPCGYKWDIVELFAANNVTAIDQYPNYVKNENIEFVSSSIGTSGVADWKPGMQNNVITLRYNPKKEVPLTAIKIVAAGEHEIILVFASDNQTPPPPPPVPGASGKPDLSCAWKSTYGDIHWSEGYYGSPYKTISGELVQRNGTWMFEGQWGRNGGSGWGKVVFTFSSPTEFTGYWTEKDGTSQTAWTGSGECILIKR
jgi:hypothetical protein